MIRIDSTPDFLVEECLDFYNKRERKDHYDLGYQYYASAPQTSELPLLYEYVKSIGYKFEEQVIYGNFFESSVGYNIHTDDSTTTFLLPLYVPQGCHSYLFILNQIYDGEPASFRRHKTKHKPKYRKVFEEYDETILKNYNVDLWDDRFNDMIPHISSETFEGMSVDTIFKWRLGKLLSFPSNRLHFSTTNLKDKHKIGLSFRLNLQDSYS